MVMVDNPNKVFSRVGPGTPMGNLFRRFWLPAVLSKQLPESDGTPVRLRILCEDLVAFRDSDGEVGIIDAFCRHRLAPLYFGRNEECGLRCVYHGWKWNRKGECVDIPNIQPPDNYDDLKEKARIKSYPTFEKNGLVWVYMGPADKQPPVPGFEWMNVPADQVMISSWIHHSNFHLAMEGEIDTSHISFLHSSKPDPDATGPASALQYATDGAPEITLHETDYGYVYGSRRNIPDQYYWRITQWMLPMWSAIPGGLEEFVGNGRGWVPIDDNTTMAFGYMYRADRPFAPQERAFVESGAAFPPRTEYRPVEISGGRMIDAYDTVANKGNDYLIDRQIQKTKTYTGIWGINEQDRGLIESMPWANEADPGVVDTTREMLVRSDYPIMVARRRLIKMATDLEKGIEPVEPSLGGNNLGVRAVSIISKIGDFDELMVEHGEQTKAAGPAKRFENVS
ncbi:Rieske 2Fe-2S domain-containing protein [Sphingomonas sp.]|uniref:Rieske 2Fe-2S domain-containing protein n=1 Tax=Sphingomonas sp. TaxID=28214 RepID=UPI0025EC07CC|nr:Rieske 2Fe-2S domain-containing protein [Sphingomonas sp.]